MGKLSGGMSCGQMTDSTALGVDGCWLAVIAAGGRMTVRKRPTFRELAESHTQATIVVDVPIGLFEDPRPGGRECDQLARQLLGVRRSSVFSAPPRHYLAAQRFEEVSGMSIQSFSIRDKIKELDDFITSSLQDRVFEGHPEVSFAHLAGQPMQSGKKSQAGNLERRQALATAPGNPFLQFVTNPRAALQREGITKVEVDDLLDACIMLWTALRIVAGHGVRIPKVPPVDRRGLRMEMWA